MYGGALINDKETSTLVDAEATYNFVSSATAMCLGLKLEKREGFLIVANAADDKPLDGIAHCSNQLVLYLKQN